MSTSEKVLLSSKNISEYLAANFDYLGFESTMSREERLAILARAEECFARGEDEQGDDILGEIPLEPTIALRNLVIPGLGADYLREFFNLADAEKAFGQDWLERFEVVHECF